MSRAPPAKLEEGRKAFPFPLAKLGEPCPKVRLSQDRLPIEPLTQQQSWVGGKRKAFGDYYIWEYYVREKFMAPFEFFRLVYYSQVR